MNKEIIENFLKKEEFDSLIQNAYSIDFTEYDVKIQGKYNSGIIKEKRYSLNFVIDESGFTCANFQQSESEFDLPIRIVFT